MTSTGKLIALIPARSGSKRVPGKNIRELAGHPLIAYTIQVAKDSGLFGEHIYVSSDSEEYLEIAERYGARGLLRPEWAAQDNSPDATWIDSAFYVLPCQVEKYFILRPTSPFRTHETLKRAMDTFCVSGVERLKALSKVSEHPSKMWTYSFRFPDEGPCLAWPLEQGGGHLLPTQKLRAIHVQNASLEIRTKKEYGTDAPIMPFFTVGYEGFDINTPDDFILAEALIERGLATLPEIK